VSGSSGPTPRGTTATKTTSRPASKSTANGTARATPEPDTGQTGQTGDENGGSKDAGAALLDEVRAFVGRFCRFPDEHALAVAALWAAHAHVVEHLHTTPRFAVLSPDPGSGKTRVLEVLDLLVPAPMFVFSASPAAIFRTMRNEQTTLLFDEVDTVFGRRGKDDDNGDLRALLNAGYKRGATIPRCVGPAHDVEYFPVFAAVALAGLGDLPDTLMSRAIIVRMRKRKRSEPVEPFRHRVHAEQGHKIRDHLAAWAVTKGADIGKAWPELPAGIVDRPAEVWEPLIAVADAAGGHWPETARAACTHLCAMANDRTVSLGVRLLRDLSLVWGKDKAPGHHTADLLNLLCGETPYDKDDDGDPLTLLDAPWSSLRGEPLDARGLARLLAPYEVRSTKVKVDGRSLQGYRREDLWDAWQREGMSPGDETGEPGEPGEPCRSEHSTEVPDMERVPEPADGPEPDAPPLTCDVPAVPEVPDFRTPESDVPSSPEKSAIGATGATADAPRRPRTSVVGKRTNRISRSVITRRKPAVKSTPNPKGE